VRSSEERMDATMCEAPWPCGKGWGLTPATSTICQPCEWRTNRGRLSRLHQDADSSEWHLTGISPEIPGEGHPAMPSIPGFLSHRHREKVGGNFFQPQCFRMIVKQQQIPSTLSIIGLLCVLQ
jgi:hypothetical protein